MPRGRRPNSTARPPQAESYQHPESESPMRPDVGTQASTGKPLEKFSTTGGNELMVVERLQPRMDTDERR